MMGRLTRKINVFIHENDAISQQKIYHSEKKIKFVSTYLGDFVTIKSVQMLNYRLQQIVSDFSRFVLLSATIVFFVFDESIFICFDQIFDNF